MVRKSPHIGLESDELLQEVCQKSNTWVKPLLGISKDMQRCNSQKEFPYTKSITHRHKQFIGLGGHQVQCCLIMI